MSNSAVVRFVSTEKTPPLECQIYLHWNGGPESVYAFRDWAASKGMLDHSVDYAVAKLATVIGVFMGLWGNTSLGLMPVNDGDGRMESDHGVYVFMTTNTVGAVAHRYTNLDAHHTRDPVKIANAEAKAARKDPGYQQIYAKLTHIGNVLATIDKIEDAAQLRRVQKEIA